MDVDIEQIVREYIDASLHMSLATAIDGKPWVSEVHFVYDDNLNLYWRSRASRRHSQEIAVNPNVAGNIVRQHALDEYPHAVYFEGKAARIEDDQERSDVFLLFKKRLGTDESVLDEAKDSGGHHFYKITVENWYAFGKFGKPAGQKYQLRWNGGGV